MKDKNNHSTECDNNSLAERLLECEKKLANCEADLKTWTDSLEELSEMEDAFKTDDKFEIDGKTILDVGTDCVKPLYIALKFKPDKIVGINEDLSVYSFESDLKQRSKLLIKTKIGLHNCSLFDNEKLNRIIKKEKISNKRFDFVLVSKTLHHLRTGICDKKHKHREDEEGCIYKFEEQMIFKRLFELGKRVIVYEFFNPNCKDNDKVRGRGGYFSVKEWKRILEYLSGKYKVKFTRPEQFHLNKKALDRVKSMLRRIDCICFYIEELP